MLLGVIINGGMGMTQEVFFCFIVGAGIGLLTANVLLVFFQDEIFGAIDKMRDKVRRALGFDA